VVPIIIVVPGGRGCPLRRASASSSSRWTCRASKCARYPRRVA